MQQIYLALSGNAVFIATLTIVVINIFLGGFVFFKNKTDTQNRLFLLFTSALTVWVVSLLVAFDSQDNYQVLLSLRFAFSGVVIFAAAFFHFAVVFPTRLKIPKQIVPFVYLGAFSLALTSIVTEAIVVDITILSSGGYSASYGALYPVFGIYFLSIISTALGLIIYKYKYSENDTRSRIRLFLIGTTIAVAIATTTNLIIPALSGVSTYSRFGPMALTSFLFLTAYAIARHNLLNVKVIATEMLTLVIGFIFFIQLLLSGSQYSLSLNTGVFLVFIVFGVLLIRSVYKEVNAREEIERLAEDLRVANIELKKLDEAKSEFVSIASHQLRTPLSIIKGYLSMAREGSFGKVSKQMMKTLNRIYLSNERLIKLVNDLLDLSRMESGRMQYLFEYFDFKEFINSLAEEFKLPAADKGIKVSWDLPKEPLKVWGDPQKLRQVVFNIIDNALKYTNEGGHIEISVKKEDDKARLKIADSGIGMSREALTHIFQKFVRGKEVPKLHTEGAGLGLYVAKKIVDDHKGDLWAESRGEGAGSTFFLTVLLKNPEESAKQLKNFIEKI